MQFGPSNTQTEMNLAKQNEVDSNDNEMASNSCVTCRQFQENEEKLEMIISELKRVRQKSDAHEVENKRLKEFLNEAKIKRDQRRRWIKNPFRNKSRGT